MPFSALNTLLAVLAVALPFLFAVTAPAQENTSGQKLGDGGAVTAHRKGSATASTASSESRAENGIARALRKAKQPKGQ